MDDIRSISSKRLSNPTKELIYGDDKKLMISVFSLFYFNNLIKIRNQYRNGKLITFTVETMRLITVFYPQLKLCFQVLG